MVKGRRFSSYSQSGHWIEQGEGAGHCCHTSVTLRESVRSVWVWPIIAETRHLIPGTICALVQKAVMLKHRIWFPSLWRIWEKLLLPRSATPLACLNFQKQSHDVVFLHRKVFHFVFVEQLLYYCTCKCGGKTVRGCQHIAGCEQTAHERREKTICICVMLILEELVSFDVKQNTPNYLSLLHTHTLTECSTSVYLWG